MGGATANARYRAADSGHKEGSDMIPDSLLGGLIICAVNLVVVIGVLGAFAWMISLVSALVGRFERRSARPMSAAAKER